MRRASVPFLSLALIVTGLIAGSSLQLTATASRVRTVGTIASIDATAETVTLNPQQGSPLTVKVNSSTQITIDGATASLLDLSAAMRAGAVYNPATSVALRVTAHTAHSLAVVDGNVTTASATSVTIAAERHKPVTLTAAATLHVVLDGADSTRGDLNVGDEARAFFDPKTLTAFIVDARTPVPPPAGVTGSISTLGTSSLTIAPDHGPAVALTTASTTKVFLDGAPSTLPALAVGDHARAIYDSSTLVAEVIHAQSPRAQVSSVNGKVTAVGSASITITPEGGSAIALTTIPTTQIFLDGRMAALSTIAVGDEARATYDATTMVAALIAAASPTTEPAIIVGTVTADSSSSVTITPHSGSPVSLTADSSSKIFVNGRPAALGAIPVGDSAQALYDPTTLVALAINAHTPAQQLGTVHGNVTADSSSAVTITPVSGSPVTLTSDAHTQVSVNGTNVALGAIPVGDVADAVYDSSSLVAVFISAHTPVQDLATVQGNVTVSSASSISIAPSSGSPVTLTGDPSTKVFLDGASSTLSDIAVGDEAHAVYDTTSMVAIVIEASSRQPFDEVEGNVSADSSSSITITPEEGSAVTLTADSSTLVVLDGAPSSLGSIPEGAEAHARYNATTLVATSIEAQSLRHELAEIEGSVSASTASSLTVTTESGHPVTVTVVAATQIFRNGRVAALTDLVNGDEVRVLYDSGTMEAALIEARSQSSHGPH